MDDHYHEVDLLLSCTCVIFERIEAAVFTPNKGEARRCSKHNKDVTVIKVGYPYRIDVPDEKEKVAQPTKG